VGYPQRGAEDGRRTLVKLGVTRLEDAGSRDPDEMYHELCAIDAMRHDPCVRDVFAAVVSYAEGDPARPW
jgi:Pathogenicity locus